MVHITSHNKSKEILTVFCDSISLFVFSVKTSQAFLSIMKYILINYWVNRIHFLPIQLKSPTIKNYVTWSKTWMSINLDWSYKHLPRIWQGSRTLRDFRWKHQWSSHVSQPSHHITIKASIEFINCRYSDQIKEVMTSG